MTQPLATTGFRVRRHWHWLVPVLALVLYGQAARHSPAFDSDQRLRLAFLKQTAAEHAAAPDGQERVLAEAYWQRYPDIAAHPYFGTHGQLGIPGAREHYQQHGRREGRLWGPAPP